MSARPTLAVAASLIPLALGAVPAPAHAGGEGLLASLPAHAPPGVCYARVSKDASYTPPGPAHARWRLQPGSPGPVWCLVTEPGTPPVLIGEARHGWIRVRCHPPVHVARAVRPRPVLVAVAPPPPPPCCIAPPPPPVVRGPCCNLAAAPPPPPPVRTIFVPAPVPPRSPWLSWSGKSIY